MVNFNLLSSVLTVILLILPAINAWSVDFYTGEACDGDYAYHSGTGDFEAQWHFCNTPGYPNGDCIWVTNDGQDFHECTADMNPQPASFRFPTGTECQVGDWEQCYGDRFFYDGDAEKCFRMVDYWPNPQIDHFTFKCFDSGPIPGGGGKTGEVGKGV